MLLLIENIARLGEAAKKILQVNPAERVFLISGDMGAGKTTLIKNICLVLGVTDRVTSPTFSIVNEYESPGGKVYHFDLYRLKNESEAHDIGFGEYLDSGYYCLIEWPEKAEDLWPESYISVLIEQDSGTARKISASQYTPLSQGEQII